MSKPVYLQVKDKLFEIIKDLDSDTTIDSERELAIKFSASRMTIRKAVDLLVEEGYLYRNKNLGTCVAKERLHKKTAAEVLQTQEHMEHKVLYFNVKNPDPDIAHKLRISREDLVTRFVRYNIKNEIVCSVDEVYMVKKYATSDLSLFDINEILDTEMHQKERILEQQFIPMAVPFKYAGVLKIKLDTPIILIESTIQDIKGVPRFFIRTYNHPTERIIQIVT